MAIRFLLPAFLTSLSLHAAGVVALPNVYIPEATTAPAPGEVQPRAPAPTTPQKKVAPAPYLGGVPTALRSSLIPHSYPGCETKTDSCEIRYPSVDVLYWPKGPGNTQCLADVTRTHTQPPRPTGMISPDIYLVLPTPTIYDACGTSIGYAGLVNGFSTSVYKPGSLRTLHPAPSGKTEPRVFNFDDVPCPPEELQAQLDPGALYSPVIVLDSGVPMMKPGGDGMVMCDSYAIMDPPTPAADMDWGDMGWGGGDGGW